jgi:hypothetical protein
LQVVLYKMVSTNRTIRREFSSNDANESRCCGENLKTSLRLAILFVGYIMAGCMSVVIALLLVHHRTVSISEYCYTSVSAVVCLALIFIEMSIPKFIKSWYQSLYSMLWQCPAIVPRLCCDLAYVLNQIYLIFAEVKWSPCKLC